jgi:hypothetical protein
LPAEFRGKCCAPLGDLTAEQFAKLVREAADVRLHSKASQFQARARHVGWEQALWEGLFRALGYKHNVWPMQRLGELRSRWINGHTDSSAYEARLLGISGLLPPELTRAHAPADSYLRKIWDHWWRDRDEFADCLLPRSLWRLHGLRPANHPHRRIALASRWVTAGDLPRRLERWCNVEVKNSALPESLLAALQVEPDDFWSWHWTFRSQRLARAQPLVGGTRITDLAINVVLPWLWARALEGKSTAVQSAMHKRYHAWPPAEDNSLLRQARERLLGGAPRKVLATAAAQQGLIQIVRDFCEQSNSLCDHCRLPELVGNIASAKA